MSWAIKDLVSGDYVYGGGRGDRSLFPMLTSSLYAATLYNSKGPATTFINQYNSHVRRPHTMSAAAAQSFVRRDLVAVEIEVLLREVP